MAYAKIGPADADGRKTIEVSGVATHPPYMRGWECYHVTHFGTDRTVFYYRAEPVIQAEPGLYPIHRPGLMGGLS